MNTNTYNPTEEMILADGWVEYEEPKVDELVLAKQKATRAIERYDSSDEVNAFYMQGQPMWLDKSTRAGLMLRFQAEQSVGKVETTLWCGSTMYTLSITDALNMLMALELYASECYDVTQSHIANINKLQTIEELEQYNFRIGYPEKLSF